MGGFSSKHDGVYKYGQEDIWRPAEALKSVLQDISETEKESARAYEREAMLYAFKVAEAEWRRERRRLKEEVRRLRRKLREKAREKKIDEEVRVQGHMQNEAGEKWKQLYLAIKTELDDLIQKTQGEGLYWRAEEELVIEELTKELKTKAETIETLKARMASMEQERSRKEKEMDILRQSLRIVDSSSKKAKKKPSASRINPSRNLPVLACIRIK